MDDTPKVTSNEDGILRARLLDQKVSKQDGVEYNDE